MNFIALNLPAAARSDQPARQLRQVAAPSRLRSVFAHMRRRWREAATRRALSELDEGTLRDIGMTRSEIGSVAAEAHHAVLPTRVRLVGGAEAEGRS
jgi:uncharacterized protein YjiS (DUF1127 family)